MPDVKFATLWWADGRNELLQAKLNPSPHTLFAVQLLETDCTDDVWVNACCASNAEL
jgi:hypothetical protein